MFRFFILINRSVQYLYTITKTFLQRCGTVTIFFGSCSGSDFWKIMVPVRTFEKVMVPVPVPTFEKLRFRFRFQLHI